MSAFLHNHQGLLSLSESFTHGMFHLRPHHEAQVTKVLPAWSERKRTGPGRLIPKLVA